MTIMIQVTPDDLIANESTSEALLALGQTLYVELVARASAGYLWSLAELPAFLEQIPHEQPRLDPERHNGSELAVGGFSTLRLKFRATCDGSGPLVFRQARPWDPSDFNELRIFVLCQATLRADPTP
jgi:predicted secreted protein